MDKGKYHWAEGSPDKGIPCAQRAVQLRPDDPAAWEFLGRLYQALGRLDEARTTFEEAVEKVPDSATLHYRRGMVLSDLNLLDEALGALE